MALATNVYHYLPVDDAAMAWGLYLTSLGRQTVPPGSRYPLEEHPDLYGMRWELGRTLPEFQAVLITEGQGVFESEPTGSVEVPENSIFFLFPGVRHRYRPLKKTGWVQRWIGVNGVFLHQLFDQNVVRPESPVQPIKGPNRVAESFDHLLALVHAAPSRNSIVLSLHAMGMLAVMFDATVGDGREEVARALAHHSATMDVEVSQAVEFIWTRSHMAITVSHIAGAVGLTRRTLERRFRAALGHSVLEEIVACRLNRAKRLLLETRLPIKAVAYLSGFTSEERMRAVFLERASMSPRRFRNGQGCDDVAN